MKKVLVCILTVAVIMGVAYASYAASIEDDAKALTQKAAKFVKDNGKDKAIAEIMKPDTMFKKDKLFVTLSDFNGLLLANGAFPNLVGQNHLNLKDPNGKFFIKEAIEIAKTKGGGWLEWTFTDPDTKKVGPRKGWIQRVEDSDLFVMGPIPAQK